ncbi:MAG TPA: hypothetical protein VGX76_01135 [Pirellulales bacterium]|nr:hypothetical protein [Pirellulales bacterium]
MAAYADEEVVQCEENQMIAPGLTERTELTTAERDGVISRALEVCREIFPGPVTWEVDYEPEDRQHEFFVFTVTANGDPKAVVDRRCQWHERLQEIFPRFDCRLSIEPQA